MEGHPSVDVWFLKRTKAVIAAAWGLDIALVVLLGLSIQRLPNRKTPCQYQIILVLFIQGPSSPVSFTYQVVLHLAFPTFRVLLLVPLLISLLLLASFTPLYRTMETSTPFHLLHPLSSFPESNVQPSAGLQLLSVRRC